MSWKKKTVKQHANKGGKNGGEREKKLGGLENLCNSPCVVGDTIAGHMKRKKRKPATTTYRASGNRLTDEDCNWQQISRTCLGTFWSYHPKRGKKKKERESKRKEKREKRKKKKDKL